MRKNWKLELSLIILAVLTVVLVATPSLTNWNPETSKWPFKKKVSLGLDLQGGLYMIFGIDVQQVYKEIFRRQVDNLVEKAKERSLEVKVVDQESKNQQSDDPRRIVEVAKDKKATLFDLIRTDFPYLVPVVEQDTSFELALTREYRKEISERTLAQSIEVIRNRIDEFGVTEPTIVSQGSDRVVVELPGVKDIERAKQLVGRTAKLEFMMVNDQAMSQDALQKIIDQIQKDQNITFKEGDRFSDYSDKINQAIKSKIPPDNHIAFERKLEPGTRAEAGLSTYIPYLLHSKVEVSGESLSDASIGHDEYNMPLVHFELEPSGATAFEKLTGENIGKRLAIVLDGIVHSAPNIQSKIPGGRGQITLGRGQSMEHANQEALDLSIVLRAGALPAKLELMEQRVIGPSLGQDSIKKGVTAGIIGCLLVFVFMMIYYRLSGVIAVVSLVLNVSLVFAAFVLIGATLTLPGIAGLALTIGMAVDSNVIIFERIRDELRDGVAIRDAVERGFDRAFTCIFDANITHGIVGVILLQFGTGPVKGFAVTLLIGILTTLFCAVTVARFLFDVMLGSPKKELKSLSI